MRRLHKLAIAGSAFAFAVMAVPANAGDSQQPHRAEYGAAMTHGSSYMPSPEERVRWIAECSDRLAGEMRHMRKRERREERDRARSSCERYYDDYYAYYGEHRQQYTGMYAPASRPQPMAIYDRDCVPCDRPISSGSGRECTETIEYEYVDVPVRRRAPPPAPTKRVKVVPDKRIKLK